VARAREYAAGGARAISVLTEATRFGGSADDLREVSAALRIPILKKDFHVDPIQLIEAQALGASAVLLIARALSPTDLKTLRHVAADLGLEVVVEIRDLDELDRALGVDARIIGVNNRDLETLRIDPTTTERLIPAIPADRIAIAESGMRSAEDVAAAAAFGADAVLIGSWLSAHSDPAGSIRALAHLPTKKRDG
jgi:indole-3-glycerol phosphate synthase